MTNSIRFRRLYQRLGEGDEFFSIVGFKSRVIRTRFVAKPRRTMLAGELVCDDDIEGPRRFESQYERTLFVDLILLQFRVRWMSRWIRHNG